jgi:hypothetical protein
MNEWMKEGRKGGRLDGWLHSVAARGGSSMHPQRTGQIFLTSKLKFLQVKKWESKSTL